MINLEHLSRYDLVAIDVETTGLHWYRDKMFGVAVAGCDVEKGVMHSGYFDLREKPGVAKALNAELQKCNRIVNHNIKFDAHFCREAGILLPQDKVECTSVRAALINENEKSFSLDALSIKYTDSRKADIWAELAALFGGKPTKEVQIKNLHRAPTKLAAKYATPDPELAIKLWLWQEKEIKRQGLEKVWDLERRVMPVLIDIERVGVRVDEERARNTAKTMGVKVADAQRKMNKVAGFEVNANSPKQMQKMLGVHQRKVDGKDRWFTKSGIELESTDAGGPSLGKDVLTLLAERGDERAAAAMLIRRYTKAQQFLNDHILGHAVNGRVHPNYNQTRGESGLGTGTGRFSIDDPALQQIPARDIEVAEQVRPCFLPEKGDDWHSADWEQFEFRWFAHYTKDPNILRVYEENPDADYHKVVADITGIPRNPRFAGDANAKQINLGLVFGMGEGTMAYEMGLEYKTVYDEKRQREWRQAGDKAKQIFATYHNAIPGVKKLLDQASSIARSRGHVTTAMGRHIRFPGGNFTHKAGGLVFQGTSADCMKQKMVELYPICKKEGWQYMLSVHDEHNVSIPKKQRAKGAKILKEVLETFDGERCPIHCGVPIRSSVKAGANWWEACKKG